MRKYKDMVAEEGSRYEVGKAINEGRIKKIERGYYALADESVSANSMAFLCQKYPQSIVTMDSAFYLHGLTDVIPDKVTLATLRNATRIQSKNVKQYYETEKYFGVGKEKRCYEKTEIPVYDKERMLIELMRRKATLPYDYYKEILLKYRNMDNLEMDKLENYLERLGDKRKYYEMMEREVF